MRHTVPEPDGVKLTEQVEVAELMVPRPQPPLETLPVAVLVLLRLTRTIPDGVVGETEGSFTTTVHVGAWFTATEDGTHETVVVVE
jgi:hypothetical protein